MNINQLSEKPISRLPVNRIIFATQEQQKKFTLWVFHIALLFVLGIWIVDIIKYANHTLELDTAFWVRQAFSVIILCHALLIIFKYFSITILSLSIFMNAMILYLSFVAYYFPTPNFSVLVIIPTIFVIAFYEGKIFGWFFSFTAILVITGFLLSSAPDRIWNAFLITVLFIIISLIVYIQNPSVRLIDKLYKVREEQFVNLLKLVYDGVAILRGHDIIDSDDGFVQLFQVPQGRLNSLQLNDILAPEAYQYVYEALLQQNTAELHTLGKKFDGTIIPIEMYMARQTYQKVPFMILTFHDSSNQLGTEYALQRKNNELMMINRISSMVNSSLSLGEVLSVILEECQNIFHTRSTSLWLVDEKTSDFVCVNAKGINASKKIGTHLTRQNDLFKLAMEQTKPVLIEDVRNHPLRDALNGSEYGIDLVTVLILPIIFQNKIIGLMQFLDDREKILREEDIEVLQSIASNSAIAITNARQFERMAGDQQRWKIVQTISQRINASLQPQDIYRAISDNIRDILAFDYFRITLFNRHNQHYEAVHQTGRLRESHLPDSRTERESIEKLMKEGKAYVSSFAVSPDISDTDGCNTNHCSILSVPMIHQGKPIGALSLESMQPNQYQTEDIQMMELIAMHTVIALENANHYQDALASARLRDTIYLIGQEINARLNPDQVYDAIFRAIEKVVPFDLMFISAVDYEQNLHFFRYFNEKKITRSNSPDSLPLDQGVSGYVIKTGKTYISGDFTKETPELFQFLNYGEDDDAIHSVLFVPMIRNQMVTGILCVQSEAVNMYTRDHQTILELIAPYAATALENAWLFSKIENQAITDELSTVYNRHYFNQTLKLEVERGRRYQRPLSLMIIDIDNFKAINDHYGHICGDEVIQHLGSVLKKNVRESDILARFGGDEFAIIMPETSAAQAEAVCKKIENLFHQESLKFDEAEIHLTASIGLAEMVYETDKKAEDLIYKADYAMYHAKRSGRDRVFVYPL